MKRMVEVGICGYSLFLAGIEMSLKSLGTFELRRMNNLVDVLAERHEFDVIIFERIGDTTAAIGDVLREYPQSKLVELVSEQDTITLFSASKHTIRTTAELIRIMYG